MGQFSVTGNTSIKRGFLDRRTSVSVGRDRQKSAESGRPKGQWTFHAAFVKVGEEQSNDEKRLL